MKLRARRRLAGVAVTALAVGAAGCSPWIGGSRPGSPTPLCGSRASDVIATTAAGELLCIDADRPARTRPIGLVTGLDGDERLVGIDARVQDRALYGLGDTGGLYTLDPSTGAATKVGALTVALSGTEFGVDFNPAANALRVVSDTGQNLRHPFAGPAAGVTQVDAPLNTAAANPALGITGAAYTNNDLDPATGTTLFDLDSATDQVLLQAPPNAGTLAPTGSLGVDATTTVGFDIVTKTEGGRAVGNVALATVATDASTTLYRIDVLTGQATPLGTVRSASPVTGIAIPIRG